MLSFSKTRALILLLFLPTFCLLQSSTLKGGGKELKIGKKAPLTDVKMDAVDGQTYALDDLVQDNGLIVIFSCNTCPFVVGNSSFKGWEVQYNDLHKAAKENNIGLVLVNSNEAKRGDVDSMDEMKTHAEAAEYTMPYVVDKDSELANAFGAKTTPHVFVFDAKKKLVYKGSIDNSWDSKRTDLKKYLYGAIDHLGKGSDLSEATSAPRGCSIKRTKK